MKAIEFLRVSTAEQAEDDRAGLPRQREANARTIVRHGLEIVKTITLINVSGTSVLEAPEVKEMLSIVESNDIKGIVVADWDRLSRLSKFTDVAYLLEHLKETDTKIFLPDQTLDLSTQSGTLMGGIYSVIANNELTQIKKRMFEAKKIKRKDGKHPDGDQTLPYGVSYDREKERFYYNENAWKVKSLFEKFYNEGIQNFHELERLTGFKHRTISNLLRNEIYIGYRKHNQKQDKVKVIDSPLINEMVFYDVQEMLRTKNKEYHKKRSTDGERFLYTGFLRCGICGEKIYTASGGRNHKKDYYCCKTKKNGDSKSCSSSYMPKAAVEESITGFVTHRLTDKKYLKTLIEQALSDDEAKEAESESANLKVLLKKLEGRRSRLIDLYEGGDIDKAEFRGRKEKIDSEKELLTHSLKKIEGSAIMKDQVNLKNTINQMMPTLYEYAFWTPIQKREFLRAQLIEFRITKDGITGCTINGVANLRKHKGRDSWPPPG